MMCIILRSVVSIDVTKFLSIVIYEILSVYLIYIAFVLFSDETNSTQKR